MSRRSGPAALALAALVAAAACAPSPQPVGPERAPVIGILGDGSAGIDDPAAGVVAAAVSEPLVRRTATEELEPRLALSVPSFAMGDLELTSDGGDGAAQLAATFALRDGLTWHDGAPLDAGDVRFAFESDRRATAGSPARLRADRIDRVEVLDPLRVRVVYRPGERWDLFATAPRALPRHMLEGADAEARARYDAAPVHAGPYRIASRSADAIVLEAFAGHFAGRPPLPRIVVRAFSDRTALLSALLSGAIDAVPSPGFNADLAATLDRSVAGRDLRVLYTQAQSVVMLRFGGRLADPAVRRAIALAVDRGRTARATFGGRVRIPSAFLVAPLWAAAEAGPPAGVDRGAARALLEGAGVTRGALGIAELGGQRLVVRLLVSSGGALLEAARGVAVDIASLGIAASAEVLPAPEVAARVRSGDFDLALLVESADDPLLATERYRGVVSPWFDVLADAAKAAADRAQARELYAECEREWSQAAAALPLYQVLKVDVVPSWLAGVRPASHSAPLTWNAGEWRIATAP